MQLEPQQQQAPSGGKDVLQHIFERPERLEQLLYFMLQHVQESLGEHAATRDIDVLRAAVAQRRPYANVALAVLLIDMDEQLRQHVVRCSEARGAEERAWTCDFLVFVHELSTRLRSADYVVANVQALLVDFACVLASAYLQRQTTLVQHVRTIVDEGRESFDALGYTTPISAETLGIDLRQRGAFAQPQRH
jgi:hypothetical protein